jgi:alpha-tubulin suppressor-like RCC1 family protein
LHWGLTTTVAACLFFGCAQIAGLTDHQPYPPDASSSQPAIIQVTAGVSHACALTRTGDVWCWGANDSGQLGHRTTAGGSCTTKCPAGKVEGVTRATQVSAGDGFTCAVLATGAVHCWGRDAAGALGRPTTTTCGMNACDPVPDAVIGVSSAVQVSAGAKYACARTSAGDVFCWGDNTYGQLGTGDMMVPASPKPVAGFGKAVDISAALVGANTCAVASTGSVWCWGMNTYGGTGHTPGSMGDVMSSDNQPSAPSPALVQHLASASNVDTGDLGACAKLASGDFWCWGYDGLGCLGRSDSASPTVALPPAPVVILQHLAVFSMRYSHACGVDLSGSAWCWGQSGIGALGPEKTAPAACDQMVACQRQAQDTGLGSVAAIETGLGLTVALRDDGTVYTWGEDDVGQLGHTLGATVDAGCPADPKIVCDSSPSAVQGLPR